jgi:autotransporter-associated beta strand protein
MRHNAARDYRALHMGLQRASEGRRAGAPYTAASASPGLRWRYAALVILLVSALVDLPSDVTHAQDATWLPSPASNNFDAGSNWNTGTVPTGTASFGTSNTTNLAFSTGTTIGGWTFNSGASSYTFNSAQTLTFNGAGIAINGGSAAITNSGALNFNGSSTAGDASITTNNFSPASVTFSDSSTAGNANITSVHLSSLVFQGSSTAGSATIFNDVAATIDFYGGSTAGSASIDNINDGALRFHGTSTAGNATINNNIATADFFDSSTAGSARITNGGGLATVTFHNTSTAGNAMFTNNRLLFFHDNSTAGSATIINNNILEFFDASTAGSATIASNLILDFANNSSAGSATIANNFVIDFFNTSRAGNASITTNSGGKVFFWDSSDGGTARFIFNGTGLLDISQLTAGGTTLGSIEGNGSAFLGAKNLAVGSNNLSTTFSGVIQDGGAGGGAGGSLTKVGTGTLTLSGTNTYTGATTINAGTLEVDGSIANSASVTVNAGGTLSGTGTVDPAATTIMGGGTLAPGNAASPTGSLTITGSLAFQSGAIYLIQVTPTAASSTNVTGTASLAGAVQIAPASGIAAQKSYDILHAAGGLGGSTFAGVISSNPNFGGNLSYTSTDVLLGLKASLGNSAFLNQNQRAIASGLNVFFNAGGTLPGNFASLFGLTGANLANALSQASGELAADAQTGAFQQLTEFLNLMNDPSMDSGGGNSAGSQVHSFAEENAYTAEKKSAAARAFAAYIAFAAYMKAPPLAPVYQPRWNVWAAGYGGYNKTNGDPVVGSNDVMTRTGGGAAGADYHFSPNALVGFALAGGGTSWDLAQGLGTGDADVFQAGLYGKGYVGPWYVAASVAFADNWMRTNRTGPFGDQLRARFNAQDFGGRVETGYRFAVLPAFGITPYAAVQAQSFHAPAYSEADMTFGGFGLSFPSRNASDTRSELGARFDLMTALSNMPLTLRARLAWAHDWITNPTLNAVFESLPGVGFTVNGAAPAKDRVLASLGGDLQIAPNWTLAAKFDGEFASHSNTYGGTGTVRYTW